MRYGPDIHIRFKAAVTLERIDVRMRSVLSTQIYVGEIEHFSNVCACSTHRERMGNGFSVCPAYAECMQCVQLIMSLQMTTNAERMSCVCPAYARRSRRMQCELPAYAVRTGSF